MGCGHGWHGCGPWHDAPHGRGWYGSADWYEEPDRPIRPPFGRSRLDRASSPGDLEARLDELRDEIRRMEAELLVMRGGGGATTDRT